VRRKSVQQFIEQLDDDSSLEHVAMQNQIVADEVSAAATATCHTPP